MGPVYARQLTLVYTLNLIWLTVAAVVWITILIWYYGFVHESQQTSFDVFVILFVALISLIGPVLLYIKDGIRKRMTANLRRIGVHVSDVPRIRGVERFLEWQISTGITTQQIVASAPDSGRNERSSRSNQS